MQNNLYVEGNKISYAMYPSVSIRPNWDLEQLKKIINVELAITVKNIKDEKITSFDYTLHTDVQHNKLCFVECGLMYGGIIPFETTLEEYTKNKGNYEKLANDIVNDFINDFAKKVKFNNELNDASLVYTGSMPIQEMEIAPKSDYELFSDNAYYDMYCVRNTNDKRFDTPTSFHFDKKEDAEKFKELIEKAK